MHTPVLVEQVLKYLIGNPAGIYVDGTLGGGNHSFEILKKLKPDARLIGIDWDDVALEKATARLQPFKERCTIKKGNFKDLKTILAEEGIEKVDGILLDIGLSSFLIDDPKRGFSYLANGPLDMRMSTETERSAADILNEESESELARIFRTYGEERRARAIARAVVQARQKNRLETTKQFTEIIESVTPHHLRIKTLARCYQAIRIVSNKELDNLRAFLEQSVDLLQLGGRLVIISFHSLEDRLVKNFLTRQANPCQCPPELPVCVCNKKPTLKILTKKVVVASSDEIKANPRSRSAKLRAAMRI